MFGESAGSCSAMAVAMTFEDDYKTEIALDDDVTLASTHLNESSKVAAVLDHWGSDDIATQLVKRDNRQRLGKVCFCAPTFFLANRQCSLLRL
jgi:hypothetical protein